ncbi:hypothetical protein ABID30_003250 [Enterococcus rotai]|uniref:hypothetical protein n=1 Tax=Enterococcus rotai TaxID=118060 RepID=UPI0033973935
MSAVIISFVLFLLAVTGFVLNSVGREKNNEVVTGIGTGISICVIIVVLVRWLL